MKKKLFSVFSYNEHTQETTCTIKQGDTVLAKETVKRYHTDLHDVIKARAFSFMKAADKTSLDYKDKAVAMFNCN